MGAGMGGGGHANNPTFMFQVCCHLPCMRSPTALLLKRALACSACTPRPPPAARLLAAQADFAKKKWKGAVFVISVTVLGVWVPWKCVSFAQKKAGVW